MLDTVTCVPSHPHRYVREFPLCFEHPHPLVAVVHRAVLLRDHFKLVVGIIALARALGGLVGVRFPKSLPNAPAKTRKVY